jgi:hypothetical protein
MEILTPESGSVVKKGEKSKPTITICKEEILLSGRLIREFNIKIGSKLVFVADVGRLYFYIAKRSTDDGFTVKAQVSPNTGVEFGRVQGVRLCRVLRERFPELKKKGNNKHLAKFCTTQINECLTFEVLIDKKP